jgi:hypothetical protein
MYDLATAKGIDSMIFVCGMRWKMSNQPMASKRLRLVHPGDILKNDFLEPLEITSYRLSKELVITCRGEADRGKSAADARSRSRRRL